MSQPLQPRVKSGTGKKRRVRSPNSPRSSTSASSPSPPSAPPGRQNSSRSPGIIFLPGRTSACQLSSTPASLRVSRTSTRPCRKSREAGFAGLKSLRPAPAAVPKQPRRKHPRIVEHHQVSGPQKRRKIAENPVLQASPFKCSSREAVRSAGGCCAISSGGSRKSKSETSTKVIIGLRKGLTKPSQETLARRFRLGTMRGRGNFALGCSTMNEHEFRLEVLRFGKMLHEHASSRPRTATSPCVSIRFRSSSLPPASAKA